MLVEVELELVLVVVRLDVVVVVVIVTVVDKEVGPPGRHCEYQGLEYVQV